MNLRHIVAGVALGTSCTFAGGVLALALYKPPAPPPIHRQILPGFYEPAYRPAHQIKALSCSKEDLRLMLKKLRDCRKEAGR